MSSNGKKRAKVNKEVETQVLVTSRRRCCLCYYLDDKKTEQKGQIAHLNQNPSDSEFSNLVFLCLNHHDGFDSRTSQAKGYTSSEIEIYRDRLYKELGTSETIPANYVSNDFEIEPDLISETQQVIRKAKGKLDFLEKPWRSLLQEPERPEFFAFKAKNRYDGICLIERINLLDGRVVIICEDVVGNPGNSITNAVEEIAFQVCYKFGIDPEDLIWLEHYPITAADDDYGWEWTQVSFEKRPPEHYFEGPKWRKMKEQDWRALGFYPRPSRSKYKHRLVSRIRWYRR